MLCEWKGERACYDCVVSESGQVLQGCCIHVKLRLWNKSCFLFLTDVGERKKGGGGEKSVYSNEKEGKGTAVIHTPDGTRTSNLRKGWTTQDPRGRFLRRKWENESRRGDDARISNVSEQLKSRTDLPPLLKALGLGSSLNHLSESTAGEEGGGSISGLVCHPRQAF